jgi:hypothetical protein
MPHESPLVIIPHNKQKVKPARRLQVLVSILAPRQAAVAHSICGDYFSCWMTEVKMDADEAKAHFIKTGREHGLTDQEALGLKSDEFFRQLNSHWPDGTDLSQQEVERQIADYWDSKFPI